MHEMTSYTGPNWDEIDALPQAEQDKRVVRLVWSKAWVGSFSGDIYTGQSCPIEGNNYNMIGTKWRKGRQHPTVAAWERQSRAEYAKHKAEQRSNRQRVCNQCGKWVYFDNGAVTFNCLCSDNRWKWQVELPLQAQSEVAGTDVSLGGTIRRAGIADRMTKWVQQSPEAELLRMEKLLARPQPEVAAEGVGREDDQPYVDTLKDGTRVWCDSVLPDLKSASRRHQRLAQERKEFIHTYDGALETLIMREDELREVLRRERSSPIPAQPEQAGEVALLGDPGEYRGPSPWNVDYCLAHMVREYTTHAKEVVAALRSQNAKLTAELELAHEQILKDEQYGITLMRERDEARAELERLKGEMGWRLPETAPQDGSPFIGQFGRLVYRTYWRKYYVKWPHEEGGPTYRGEWTYEDDDSITPDSKMTGWMPFPSAPTAETEKPGGGE